ncbi:MAG: hypothetical protein GKR90_01420 [Pseudomonadales bacterium]|nr:hypothetical protein [Pseudomonadales bacterium]
MIIAQAVLAVPAYTQVIIHEKEVHDMDQSSQNEAADDAMFRNIGYCGIVVAIVALGIAWVANSVS